MSDQNSDAKSSYDRDGFYIASQIIDGGLVQKAVRQMDAVIAGRYDTGIAPRYRGWNPGDDPAKLVKIDEPHLCDRALFELVTSPALGRLAAQVTGAQWVQVWAAQLLYKPPGGLSIGNVGWHQDQRYWPMWEGETFTAWIALSDVTSESGPMRFVPASHRWGLLHESEKGDFFNSDLATFKDRAIAAGRPWAETPAVLPPGGVSFHHCITVHGSGPNTSAHPRRSIAVHMRTNRSKPLNLPSEIMKQCAGDYYTNGLSDPAKCPIIYQCPQIVGSQ